MLLFVGSIAISVLYNKWADVSNSCIVLDKLPTDKPMIVFGSGAGYWAYYLGIAKFIQETYKTDNMNLVGVSAGTISCLGLVNKAPIDDVFDVCLEHIRLLDLHWTGIFGRWCTSCRFLSIQCLKDHKSQIANNRRLFSAVSQITWYGLNKRYLFGGDTYEDIIDASVASYWIPFITAPILQPFRHINGAWYVDGYLSGRDVAKDALFIYPTVFERLPLSVYWLWLGRDYNIGLYNMGYEHAKKYRHKLDAWFSDTETRHQNIQFAYEMLPEKKKTYDTIGR